MLCSSPLPMPGESPWSGSVEDVVRCCGVGGVRRELLVACSCVLRKYKLSGDLVAILLKYRLPAARPFDFLKQAAQFRLSRLERRVAEAADVCHGVCKTCVVRFLDGMLRRAAVPEAGDYVRFRCSATGSSPGPGVGLVPSGQVGRVDSTTDANVRMEDSGLWIAKGAVYRIDAEDTFEHTQGGLRLYPRAITIPFEPSMLSVGPPISRTAERIKDLLSARLASEGFTGEVTVIAEGSLIRVYIQIVVLS
eukprot:TRINITY_DN13000_c0_g1_i1.p1 TRINITY_DN13000_c0_g1~~TRINITY_DN13000_c0_g1_i1.p1  ORF type:complete len:250 (+),score=59.51 TRINITY_DN13000_c0_g1_i1:51-800(+)